MGTTVLTPVDLAAATRSGPRVYRKQVLAKRTIDYPMPDGSKRRVAFDDEYLRDLAAAFSDGAYDLVPFQLAGPDNRHTEDPRHYGGRVIGAEVTDTGLDVILELSEDAAELVERTGRRLGVSARIKEALEHVDGRSFKRAIRHVLGTLDPRMTGMSPWQPVDLAHNDTDEVLDLSDYREDRTMTRLNLAALADDDRERLLELAAEQGIDLSVAADEDEPAGDEPEGDEGDDEGDEPGDDSQDDEADEDEDADEADEDRDELEPMSDDELDALLDSVLEDERQPVGAGADLSNDDDEDRIDMSAALVSEAGDGAATARRDAAEARYQLAAERYGAAGVPPHVLELCRPVLELGDESPDLELSSPATGDPIDVHGIVTGMLDALKGTVDLSGEAGRGHEDPAGAVVDEQARAWTDYLENN